MASGMDGQCQAAPQLEGVPVRERVREKKKRKGKEKKEKKKKERKKECLQILDRPQPDISPWVLVQM